MITRLVYMHGLESNSPLSIVLGRFMKNRLTDSVTRFLAKTKMSLAFLCWLI